MERTLFDWQHDYRATPSEYPIGDNNRPATYDQFITLRDTLIFSNKQYNDKAGRSLIIWTKLDWTPTDTIEIREPNSFRQSFQPTWATDTITPDVQWKYISAVPQDIRTQYSTFTNLCCMIQKDGRYRIVHKEEVLPTSSTKKVCCYVDIYRNNGNWYEILLKWWVAVFDRQAEVNKTVSGTVTTSEDSWTCSVTLTLNLWEIFQKMTAFWFIERDLKKWDILVLRMKDQWHNTTTWEPQWNDLVIQADSNYRNVEYIDLAYNK